MLLLLYLFQLIFVREATEIAPILLQLFSCYFGGIIPV